MIELFFLKLILCFKKHMIRIFGPLWYICEDDFKHNKQYQASVFRNVHSKMYVIFRNINNLWKNVIILAWERGFVRHLPD